MRDQTTQATSEPDQPQTWPDRLLEKSIGILHAERLMGAKAIDRRGRLVERLVRKTQDGTLGEATADDSGAEDVIQVGDNHYTVLPAETQPTQPASGSAAKTLATALAALLAGGGGVGATMWALSPETAAHVPPAAHAPETPCPAAADRDTRYRLQLVD